MTLANPASPLFDFASRVLKGISAPANGLAALPASLLSRSIGASASLVLNHLIAQHRRCKDKLQKEAGKVVCIEVAPVSITLRVSHEGYFVASHSTNGVKAPVDTHISMQWTDLVGSISAPSSMARRAKIEGDMDFAQVVSSVLNDLSWDSERDLARIVGDAQAVWIMSTLAGFGTNLKDVFNRFKANLREYAVYEKGLSPSADEFDAFRGDIAKLRDELARLEKRVQQVQRQGAGS